MEEVFEWFNLSLCKHPPQSKVSCIVALPVLRFQPNKTSQAVEKAYCVRNKPTQILVAKPRQRSLRQVCEICAVSKEHSRWSHRLVCANLCCRMLWHMKHIRIIVAKYISSTTIHEKNFTWWVVWHALSNNSMSGGIWKCLRRLKCHSCTILSQASTHFWANAHPPIFTVL